MKDGERQAMADHIADNGTALANLLGIRDQDGRTLIDRIRLSLAGHPAAAAYDNQGGRSPDHPDPTWTAVIKGPDGTIVADPAAVDLRQFDADMHTVSAALGRLIGIAGRHLPRLPTSSERLDTVRVANEAGAEVKVCESCHRITLSTGKRAERDSYRRGTVGDRLVKPVELCRRDYDYVSDTIDPGSRFTLERAIPLKVARQFAQDVPGRVMRPAS